jgi:AAA domain
MPTMESVGFDGLYCMFKGEPGTRKSTQALSFPGPQYWLSWDRKMNGIKLPMRKWGIDPKTVVFDDYDDWTAGKKKLEQLQVSCPYKTIVIDSITSMADMTLRQTTRLKYGVTRASGATAGKLIAGIAVNEIEDYNAESAALQELIALTKDINSYHKVNIILIAHVVKAEYRDTTKKTTHISRQIVTAGKNVAAKLPAYCGEVYHFNIKSGMQEGAGGDYTLLTTHTGDDFARTALDLPAEVVFNDKPIYDTYIKPAITKMTTPFTPVTKF